MGAAGSVDKRRNERIRDIETRMARQRAYIAENEKEMRSTRQIMGSRAAYVTDPMMRWAYDPADGRYVLRKRTIVTPGARLSSASTHPTTAVARALHLWSYHRMTLMFDHVVERYGEAIEAKLTEYSERKWSSKLTQAEKDLSEKRGEYLGMLLKEAKKVGTQAVISAGDTEVDWVGILEDEGMSAFQILEAYVDFSRFRGYKGLDLVLDGVDTNIRKAVFIQEMRRDVAAGGGINVPTFKPTALLLVVLIWYCNTGLYYKTDRVVDGPAPAPGTSPVKKLEKPDKMLYDRFKQNYLIGFYNAEKR